VIELAASDPAAFRLAAAIGARAETARAEAARQQAAPAATVPAPTRPVVMLDPGHGGIDCGAVGLNGVLEKDVVFAFSTTLADKLRQSGRYQVVMTRSTDVFMSLDDRVQAARDAHASLFVSIHADILSDPQVAGATIYTVSDRASDAEAARIAESENKADLAGGLAVSGADGGQIADILFDLTRRETRTYAHVFSRTLLNYLKDATKLNNNPVRSAGFVVLKAPDIPSVLIELGYVSSRTDIRQLESPQWRDKTANALAAAIDRFFAERRQSGEAAAQPAVAAPARTATVSVLPQAGENLRRPDPWGSVRGAGAPH
jgi:N-acetylmuramoyl-L-alanine amidase